nr:hypothetical protein [Nakamurella endophytica]
MDELVQGVGVHLVQRVVQLLGGGGLRGQADDVAAAALPGAGQDAHHGGLPVPAGAKAMCTRRPLVATSLTKAAARG